MTIATAIGVTIRVNQDHSNARVAPDGPSALNPASRSRVDARQAGRYSVISTEIIRRWVLHVVF
jgi:hypothetical protein